VGDGDGNVHSGSCHDRKSTTEATIRQRRHSYASSRDFSNLQFAHPYGALPTGNRWLVVTAKTKNASDSDISTSSHHDRSAPTPSLGTTAATTNATSSIANPTLPTATAAGAVSAAAADALLLDECWNHVLSFVSDGAALARICQTCRFLYVAGHQPELWRDLVLSTAATRTTKTADDGGDSSNNGNNIAVLRAQHMGRSWKDTYVIMTGRRTRRTEQQQQQQQRIGCDDSSSTDAAGTSSTSGGSYRPPQHRPMAVSGVYSDCLYRLHSCRSFAIPDLWLDEEERRGAVAIAAAAASGVAPRVPVELMTTERFLRHYEATNTPVVIDGGALSWEVCKKWQDPLRWASEQFQDGQTFRATSGMATHPAQFTWEAYAAYCTQFDVLEEGPLYLFDRTALSPQSALWKDCMRDLQRTCPYWDPDQAHHDLFKVLGEGRRPDHTWLIAGPKRSGSVFHIDPNATHAWNATLAGRKRWILYPPGWTPPGVHPSSDGDEVALPLSVGEWLFQYYDAHVRILKQCAAAARNSAGKAGPMECTTFPGDIMFVPHGWWHMVINLDGGLNVAITHNYVSQSNLGNVLKFLDAKRDQVSGCRDRRESIKPERLYEEFVIAMREYQPTWLRTALAEPLWTCRAWRNPKAQADAPEKNVMEEAKSATTFSFSFL
jgi:Cupin-like domain